MIDSGARLARGAAFPAALGVGLLVLAVAIARPELGAALAAGIIALLLAARSPAIPLAIWPGTAFLGLIFADLLPRGGTTAVFAGWLLVACGFALARHREVRLTGDVTTIGVVALLGLLLVRLPASPSPEYGAEKLQLFALACGIAYLAGAIVGAAHRDTMLFFRLSAGLAVAAAIYSCYQILGGGAAQENAERFTAGAVVDPIEVGRDMGATMLVLLVAVTQARRPLHRILLLVAMAPVAVALLGGGSRGPLLSLVVALVVLTLSRVRDPRTMKRLLAAVGVTLVVGSIAAAAFLPGETVARALSIFGGQDVESADPTRRGVLWREALDASGASVGTAIVGIGTGGFESIEPALVYPHNVILELWLELGILGVSAFLLAVISGLRNAAGVALQRSRDGPIGALVLSLIVFALANAMFTADIAGNAALFKWLGLATGLAAAARVARPEES